MIEKKKVFFSISVLSETARKSAEKKEGTPFCCKVFSRRFRWTKLPFSRRDIYALYKPCDTRTFCFDASSSTPLDLAEPAEQTETVKLLTQAGAKHYKDSETPAYLPALDGVERDSQWVSVPKVPAENSRPPRPSDGKARLVYDKVLIRTLKKRSAVGQFVYPSGTEGPQDNIYQVSHFLKTSSDTIGIRHSPGRAENWEYSRSPWTFDTDDMLYEATRVKRDYSEFELKGKQQNALLPGTIRMHRDWTGGWKMRRHTPEKTAAAAKPYLLRTTPEWSSNKEEDCRWLGDEGMSLVARSG